MTWDWKAQSIERKSEMERAGLDFMNIVPNDLILQDCYAAIFAERQLTDEEIKFLWDEYNNLYDNPDSLLEEMDIDNVFEVCDTGWSERHPGE